MRVQDLVIDPRGSLGSKLWLTEISAVYAYKDNVRGDEVVAHKYIVTLPEKSFEKIAVKIDGKKLMEQPESYAEVKFDGLELFIYWMNGQPNVAARAANISLVNAKT